MALGAELSIEVVSASALIARASRAAGRAVSENAGSAVCAVEVEAGLA